MNQQSPTESQGPLVSVVMPCFNEEEAVGSCIKNLQKVFIENNINGEIIICDNGSSDRSVSIAKSFGVQVVHQPKRGYGNAYLKGFSCARGKYLIMADVDGTYDFDEIPNFLRKLIDEKYDFVTGSRYLNTSEVKSMPFLHQYVGNPLLTMILNFLFGVNYSDVYSGFRGFRHDAYKRIMPISPGMEFNLELAINAKLAGLKIAEIPIVLHERIGKSKLRTFNDGWRSLRMMLLYCPNKLFMGPGLFLLVLGILIHTVTLFGFIKYEGRALSNVTGIFAVIFSVIGFEILNFGLQVKTYSWSRRFEKKNILLLKFYRIFTLEKGLIIGSGMVAAGFVILLNIIIQWVHSDLMPLPHPEWVAFASTLTIIGSLTVFSSFFISAMSMKK
jgi:glycosyltransferase involved in cell wall biosynthesis